jgi:membrane protease YdiL (CAAX protease family)
MHRIDRFDWQTRLRDIGLQTPENYPVTSAVTASWQWQIPERPVAPVWHTAILLAGIAALSIQSVLQFSGRQPAINRLQTYAFTAVTELVMLGWIWFGLRMRKIPLRSLLGEVAWDFKSVAIDFGFGFLFWIASLMILGSIGVFWMVVEAAIKHQPLLQNGKQLTPDATQQHTLHTLTQLAPANGLEIAAWILLCIIAGIAEEMIFRGYLQRQFTAWSRGAIVAGVALSSLLFGAAHGYQGMRNMVLLAVFGVLFSLLALFRRNLRAGIFAHSWQDLFAGLTLALLKAHHMI